VNGGKGIVGRPRVLDRVQEYLDRAKYEETDPWLADDYCVAADTIRNLRQGWLVRPWELAFAMYYGMHPLKLIPIFLERDRKRRELGPSLGDPGEMERVLALLALPPKKPSQSVGRSNVESKPRPRGRPRQVFAGKFGKFVNAFRVEKLATELDVDPAAVYCWMRNEYSPTPIKAIAIVEIARGAGFRLSLEDIYVNEARLHNEEKNRHAILPRGSKENRARRLETSPQRAG
jgi:hypothetical protein